MTNTRWVKLNHRLNVKTVRAFPEQLANWAYWNGQLYRFPVMRKMRTELKRRKPVKRYGIDAPIVVYQMGKVGSAAVYGRLRSLNLDVPVFHAHALKYLVNAEQGLGAPEHDSANLLHLPAQERELWRAMQREKCWHLITPVRAPVPRAISVFFHRLYQNGSIVGFKQRLARNEIAVSELLEAFSRFDDIAPRVWFEHEMHEVFGIDVYAKAFRRERGYEIYECANIRLLVIRLEDASRSIAPAMQEFLGLENFRLTSANTTESLPYGALYSEFLTQLRLSPKRVAEWHTTQYARHFYTPEELATSVERWT
jgi:hypothetical protein